jgi:hypothetical protein
MIDHVEALCADMEDACSEDDLQMRDVLKVKLYLAGALEEVLKIRIL